MAWQYSGAAVLEPIDAVGMQLHGESLLYQAPRAAGARGGGVVEMRHVDAAVQEMFSAVHMQLLGRACRLDKLLLVALMLETRATGTIGLLTHSGHVEILVGPIKGSGDE